MVSSYSSVTGFYPGVDFQSLEQRCDAAPTKKAPATIQDKAHQTSRLLESTAHYNAYNNVRSLPVTALKLTTIGTSTGVVIPKEMLARLKMGKGDTLYAIETAEGYLLTPV